MAWRSSRSRPSRVPASRASIRARWKRMTLRPASARWSSAIDAGRTRRRSARLSGRDGLLGLGGSARPMSSARSSGAAATPGSPLLSSAAAVTSAPSLGRGIRGRRRPRRDRSLRGDGAIGRTATTSRLPRRALRIGDSRPVAASPRLARHPHRRDHPHLCRSDEPRPTPLQLASRCRASAGSASRRPPGPTSGASSPLTSSASNSTKRSTTRDSGDDVDLIEAQLDPRLAGRARSRRRRTWRRSPARRAGRRRPARA